MDRLQHVRSTKALRSAAALTCASVLAGCGSFGTPGAASTPGLSATQPSPGPSVPGAGLVCLKDGVGALVYVVAVHKGAVSGIPPSASCALGQALYQGVPVAVISSEGHPKVITTVRANAVAANNDTTRHANAVKAAAVVARAAEKAEASSDGNDAISAMSLAADEGRSLAGQGRDIQLITADPMLSDRGAFNITPAGALGIPPKDMAQHVIDTGQCPPNLPGAHITFLGVGFGVEPQPDLTPGDRAKIQAMVTSIVQACHGQATFVAAPVGGKAVNTDHPTTPVHPTKIPPIDGSRTVRFQGVSPLSFDLDEVTFVDKPAAVTELDKIVTVLREHPQLKVTVSASTANADGGTRWPSLQALGQARANAVRTQLIGRGAPAERISAIGFGYLAKPPQVDLATAALNRVVQFEFTSA